MSGRQRPPPGGRGPSFFDSFFGGDPFAQMDSMFRSMGMGGDLFGGFAAAGSGGGTAGTFQARQPSSTAREIPIEGPEDEGSLPAQHRFTGPVIDELPEHEQQGPGHLFFSSPDHVEEPEEDEPGHRFEPHPPYHEPQQQQEQPTPQRPTEPSQPQAAPVPPPPWQPQQPPWQTQQRHNSSSSSGGGRQHSAEDLLAAMGSLPLGTQHSEPPHRPADRPAGWAAGPGGGGSGAGWTAGMGGSGGGAGESEGPGSPLLVHMNSSASPFSPQRGAHLLDADHLPPHLPPFGSLGGGGSSGGGMAGGGSPPMPQEHARMSQQQAAAADLPADWLAAAFGAGAPVQQAQQAQQAAAGRPVSWDEHAGMFVATPVSSSQPPATLQLPGGSPGQVASRPANPQQKDPGGGGGRSGAPSGLFRSAGAGAEAGPEAAGAAQRQQQHQQLDDGATDAELPQQRQRRLPAKLREAVEAQLQSAQPAAPGTAGRQRRAAAGRKRRRGSSEEEEAEEAAALEEEDPDWAVPRRPRPASAASGRTPKRGRRGSQGGRSSRGRRR